MKGPIKIVMDATEICQENLRDCEQYFVNLSIGEVLLLVATFFITLFVVLRIIYYITKDTEIF